MDNNFNSNQPKDFSKSKFKKSGYFASSLLGVVAGAVAVSIILPNIESRISATDTTANSLQNNVKPATTQTTQVKNVSLNLTTNITNAVEKTEKAVVGITNIQSQTSSSWYQTDNSQSQESGSGSGVIYKKANGKAYIVTNNHVVENADKLEVTLSDGEKLEGKLVGSDIWNDLAVVEIDGGKVTTVAQFGNSDSIKLGEPVIAIGNPLGEEFSGSVTQGIISGVNRTVPIDLDEDGQEDWEAEVIQTDAAINPGNSGGALINAAGQVIGINSMKIAEESVEGIGLAIPINNVEPIIQELETKGKITRPTMGVTLQNISDVPSYYQQQSLGLTSPLSEGVMISDVSQGSPAEEAGLQRFDVISELDGQKVRNIIELRKYIYNHKKPGSSVKVEFYHQGKKKEVTIKLSTESNF